MLHVVAIRDVKAGIYKSPHFAISTGVAIRDLSDAMADPKSYIAQHPEDYQLYLLGTLNEVDGCILGLPVPQLLASATDFIKIGG